MEDPGSYRWPDPPRYRNRPSIRLTLRARSERHDRKAPRQQQERIAAAVCAPVHGQQSRPVIAVSATGQFGMAARGQIQLSVVKGLPGAGCLLCRGWQDAPERQDAGYYATGPALDAEGRLR